MPSERSRRSVLAGAVTATAAVAGCSGVVDWIAQRVLENVTVFKTTDREVTGSVGVLDGGDRRLDESFALAPSDAEGNGGDDNPNLATYGDVWSSTGEYTVSIDLDRERDAESTATETVSIEKPDEEMLLVALGADGSDDPIEFRLGEDFSDTVEQ